MKLKIFVKQGCPDCPPAKKLGQELEKAGKKIEFVDIDTPDGLAEAVLFDVMATPSLVVVDENSKAVKSWKGETPPRKEAEKLL